MITGFKNMPLMSQNTLDKFFDIIKSKGVEVCMDSITIHGKRRASSDNR